jgi:flagellar motor switch protein FliN/FliY
MAQQDKLQLAGETHPGAVAPATGVAARQVLPMPLATGRGDLPARTAGGPVFPVAGQYLQHYLDVPMTLVFEVGRKEITVGDLMELGQGSFVDLWHVSVDIIDIRINNRIIAYGETIALKQRYGIRFGELETVFGLEENPDA